VRAFAQTLLGLCLCAALGFGGVAEAQQQASKLPRIGYLGASGDPRNPGRNFEAFRRGMKNLGYSDGESVLIEFRSAERESRTSGKPRFRTPEA